MKQIISKARARIAHDRMLSAAIFALAFVLVAGAASAATTIGTDILTGGVLSVSGIGSSSVMGAFGIGTTTPASLLSLEGYDPAITLFDSHFTNKTYQIKNSGGAFSIFDPDANATPLYIQSGGGGKSGDIFIGTTTNLDGNRSRLFVYGGSSGANIDVMGDKSIIGGDQATIEIEGSDYDTDPGSSIAMRYFGPGAVGSTMGYPNNRLGHLDFGTADTDIISNNVPNPIIFGINGKETMRVTKNGLAIGVTDATSQLQVAATSTNATTTVTIGKAGQNKGSCLELYDSAGTPVYASVAAGATTFTLSTVSCK